MLNLKEIKLQYVTNPNGEKTAVILPIAEFQELMEDIEDLALVAERRDEPTMHFRMVEEVHGLRE